MISIKSTYPYTAPGFGETNALHIVNLSRGVIETCRGTSAAFVQRDAESNSGFILVSLRLCSCLLRFWQNSCLFLTWFHLFLKIFFPRFDQRTLHQIQITSNFFLWEVHLCLLIPHCSFFIPHSSFFIPHSSLLTGFGSLLVVSVSLAKSTGLVNLSSLS